MDKQPSSRTCFLCGRQNDIGLKVTWHNDLEEHKVKAVVVVPEHFNGYPGIVHGGIVAALLDETAGRALLLDGDYDQLMVTLKLQVRYRKASPTGQPLALTGWTVSRTATRAKVAAELRLPDGSLAAESEAILLKPGDDFRIRWEPEKPFWRVYED